MKECANLGEVRQGIDGLDEQIARLLCERSHYVREAARLKPRREDIVDRERIESIIGHVRGLAGEAGVDPGLLERIYRNMIDAFIAFEEGEHARLHSASTPS
jgi:isochorismate pyruvate lyase